MTDLETSARLFLSSWSDRDAILTAFRNTLASDVVWQNIGLSETLGRDASVAVMESMFDHPVRGFEVEVQHVAVAGRTVLTERFERLVTDDGAVVFEGQVAAVFDFDEEGRIAAWREYQDTAPFAARAG